MLLLIQKYKSVANKLNVLKNNFPLTETIKITKKLKVTKQIFFFFLITKEQLNVRQPHIFLKFSKRKLIL